MLKRGTCFLVAAAATVMVLAAQPSRAAERTPPGSFLKWRVASSQQLASQVRDTSDVSRRYAAFFKKDPLLISERFSNLQLRTLDSPLRTRVYFVGRGGRVISEVRTFKKGTPVFFSESGKPILDGRCGNPLANDVPDVVSAKSSNMVESVTQPPAAQGAGVPAEAAPTQLAEAVPTPPAPVQSQVLAQPAEVLTPEVVAPVAVAPVPPVTQNPVVAAAGGGGAGGLLGLLVIPLLAGGGGGGGGGGPVVPEPAAILTLASSLAGLGCMMTRKKRS